MISSERIVKEWYNSTGEKCLKFYQKSQENEIKQIPKLLKNIPKNASILDAGCGDGKPILLFLSDKGYSVVGIDISKKLLRNAIKNCPAATLKKMSMYKLTFPSKKFDAIVSFFAILHLEKNKIEKVFKQFNRILKNDGYLLFSFNIGNKSGYSEYFGKRVFFSAYSKKEINEILNKTKFKIVWNKDFYFTKKNYKEKQAYYLVKKLTD